MNFGVLKALFSRTPLVAAAVALLVSACSKGGEKCDPTNPVCGGGGTTPTLSIADATVTEGSGGTATAVFSVTLSAASSQAVVVDFATHEGTAIEALDFLAKSGQLTFSPGGSIAQNITVEVISDIIGESDETFTVALSSPVGATLADSDGTGTITDDDVCPLTGVMIAPSSQSETLQAGDCVDTSGGGSFFYDLWMVGVGSSGQVTIDETSSDFDSELYLLELDGTLIDFNDDAPSLGTLNSRLTPTLTTGVYLVAPSTHVSNATGAYTLSVSAPVPAATESGTAAQAPAAPSGRTFR